MSCLEAWRPVKTIQHDPFWYRVQIPTNVQFHVDVITYPCPKPFYRYCFSWSLLVKGVPGSPCTQVKTRVCYLYSLKRLKCKHVVASCPHYGGHCWKHFRFSQKCFSTMAAVMFGPNVAKYFQYLYCTKYDIEIECVCTLIHYINLILIQHIMIKHSVINVQTFRKHQQVILYKHNFTPETHLYILQWYGCWIHKYSWAIFWNNIM